MNPEKEEPDRTREGVIRRAYRWGRRKLAERGGPAATALYLYSERLRRSGTGWRYSFVRLEELLAWSLSWAPSLSGFDLVIGVPRSGLLVAGVIAARLGKPLATPETLRSGLCWRGGPGAGPTDKAGRVLLVDDSVHSGKTMNLVAAGVRETLPGAVVETAALIAAPGSERMVDYFFRTVKVPRLFEWNMLHVKKGALLCDLDGVICENCPPGTDGDEKEYSRWIGNAKPYLVPSFEIDCILSARLEKYRTETESWLRKNGVRYGKLLLWDLPDKDSRKGLFSEYKISRVKEVKPEMVWESNPGQAADIHRATGIPTLCVDTMTMHG
ncbi:MAG: hypothetical protein RQ748_02870 [Elusimicrobiales bacterium]|nr:hypothetical protein [Elusimicrobiales bacterium]